MMNYKSARRAFYLAAVFSIGLILIPDAAFGCPTCKDSLHANQTAFAFAISILFMMSMPFLILAGWLTFFLKCSQR